MCPKRQKIGGSGYPESASSETSSRGKGLKITSERTGESRDKGLKTNGNPKTGERSEQSWKLARCGRFRVNGVRV
jgi:hypothetical protein